ncbi:MAG: rhodanese-like domain-containing protein [Bacteroidales bacterium]|nr:rhodanese-like domain-containing protein [Bacteroidales bacterium]
MMKFRLYFLSILFLAFIASSCQKDEKVVVNESQVLTEYLESTDSPLMKDFVNTDMPTIMGATEVKSLNETGQVYIIDIRSATDFATGHIHNAHNVALADILTHIESVDLTPYTKVAIVCYSGQTAGFAASLLRLMGYDKVYSMKWGMCSWNTDFAGGWKNAVTNGNTYASQFVATATEKGPKGDLPVLNTGFTKANDILKARVNALLTEGYTPAKVSAQSVFDNLSNYYIVNYWPANHYSDPGHIPGAIQYTPKESIKLDVDLKTLPTDKPIAVYCYTGQTSSYLAAYLRLLGYDAKSILYGANGMIYDVMVGKGMTNFSDSQIMGYDYDK